MTRLQEEQLTEVSASLEAHNITHSYQGQTKILDNFSYKFQPGELYAFVGPSGCGKSTLLHILSGLLKPLEGEIVFNKKKVTAQVLKESSFIFPDPFLIPELTCAENLSICSQDKTKQSFILNKLGLSNLVHKYPRELSTGQLQRMSCARAFTQAKNLLFADEPTSHLDKENTHNFMKIIAQLVKEQQLIFICVTHDLTLISYFNKIIEL